MAGEQEKTNDGEQAEAERMRCTLGENPFDRARERDNSSYCAVRAGRLIEPEALDEKRTRENRRTFEMLQDFVVRRPYPCVGAQASFNQEACRFGSYVDLDSREATAGLARDLFTFTQEMAARQDALMSFLAVFDGPQQLTEEKFESLLWDQLAGLHVLDRRHHAWDTSVSSNPDDATFAFSFAGHGYYIVGMHPHSARPARRFPQPVLVFNPHGLFDRLRDRGAYAKMQRVVRSRDEALSGSVNPMLQDFGEGSEARQYSGRVVDHDWRCPFHDSVALHETSESPEFHTD